MYNIDDYDLKILTLLQANGRLTNQELSELIGLSASQCSRRRIALEQAQLILGYHARLAPDAAGQEMLGLIEVRLLNHTPQCVESFHQMLSEVDAILDAWKTTGDADYLLRVTVPDLPGLSHLISHILAQNKGVAHLKTAVVLNRLKENGQLMPGTARCAEPGHSALRWCRRGARQCATSGKFAQFTHSETIKRTPRAIFSSCQNNRLG